MYAQKPIPVEIILPTVTRVAVALMLYGNKPNALMRTVRDPENPPAKVREHSYDVAVRYLQGWCQTAGEGLEHIFFMKAGSFSTLQIPPVSTGRKLRISRLPPCVGR